MWICLVLSCRSCGCGVAPRRHRQADRSTAVTGSQAFAPRPGDRGGRGRRDRASIRTLKFGNGPVDRDMRERSQLSSRQRAAAAQPPLREGGWRCWCRGGA